MICECGQPAVRELRMCARCALLDFGATDPRHMTRRSMNPRILEYLRDVGGATTTEITAELGVAFSQAQAGLERLVARGRLSKRRCLVAGASANWYTLTSP